MPEPDQTLRGATARIAPATPGALNSDLPRMTYHAPRFSDCTNRPGSPNARGGVDTSEVEVDSDGDVEEVVLLLLELGHGHGL
eukprot:2963581-Prymnesium_polylepis.1